MALRLVLVLGGLFIALTGLDVALGGIPTSGWLGSRDFIEVTSQERFLAQDNHVRFFGGVWFAMGVFCLAAATQPTRYLQALYLVAGLIFVGGLARLTIADTGVLFSGAIVGSLAIELIGMPALAFWLWSNSAKAARNDDSR